MKSRTLRVSRVSFAASALLVACGLASAGAPNQAYRDGGMVEAPHGHIYVNRSTGERIISHEPGTYAPERGAAWSWGNVHRDPCAPATGDGASVIPIYNGLHNADLGALAEPDADAIAYWSDWFEAPGDTIVNTLTFSYWTQIPDSFEDGVLGHDFLFAFTENDRWDLSSSSIAHSPVLLEQLLGAADDGADGAAVAGDGVIDFAEGNLWILTIDFAAGDTPTDIEIADTNDVSDGAFGSDSIYSGIPGVDIDGNGLYNCGFVFGFRQPGVAEGDGLIERFPELSGLGLENPDGLDPDSFSNIRPVGFSLAFPSIDPASYDAQSSDPVWPQNPLYTPQFEEAPGSTNRFNFYDAVGTEGLPLDFCVIPDSIICGFATGYDCSDAADPSQTQLPWSTPYFGFNFGQGGSACRTCNQADIAEPCAVLDLSDVLAFLEGFLAQDSIADFAPPGAPDGIFDLADISAFITAFQGGCP